MNMDEIQLPAGSVEIVSVNIPPEQSLSNVSNDDLLLNLPELSSSQLCDFCFSMPFKYIGFQQNFQREEYELRLGIRKNGPLPSCLRTRIAASFARNCSCCSETGLQSNMAIRLSQDSVASPYRSSRTGCPQFRKTRVGTRRGGSCAWAPSSCSGASIRTTVSIIHLISFSRDTTNHR